MLTKLDGTARGGIVVGIQDILKAPVCYVGVGEKLDDLLPVSYTHLDVYKRQLVHFSAAGYDSPG